MADVQRSADEPEWDRAACVNCRYWRDQALKAFEKRDRLDKMLESVDGGAGYWRETSRRLTNRLHEELLRLGTLSDDDVKGAYATLATEYQRALARALQAESRQANAKRELYSAWAGLDDSAPQKATIRKVWDEL